MNKIISVWIEFIIIIVIVIVIVIINRFETANNVSTWKHFFSTVPWKRKQDANFSISREREFDYENSSSAESPDKESGFGSIKMKCVLFFFKKEHFGKRDKVGEIQEVEWKPGMAEKGSRS